MEDRVANAVRSGALAESDVDACAARVLALVLKGPNRPKGRAFDKAAHNALAQKIAENGAVLLKNEGGILPLDKNDIVLIGEMARTMRYQGAGNFDRLLRGPALQRRTDCCGAHHFRRRFQPCR